LIFLVVVILIGLFFAPLLAAKEISSKKAQGKQK